MLLSEVLLIVLLIIVIWYYTRRGDEVRNEFGLLFSSSPSVPVVKKNATTESKKILESFKGESGYQDSNTSTGYEDFLLNESVGSDVVASHRNFVKDRDQYKQANGPLKQVDFEPSEAVPWMGMRRPQGVYVDPGASQIPDVDMDAYSTSSKLRWN